MTTVTPPPSKAALWTGRILSGLIGLFLLFDAVGKLAQPEPVVEATVKLGYPANVLTGLGITLAVCTVLYLIPQTAVLGAILLTGYFGGAVASHVRAGEGVMPATFAVGFGVITWLGLYLREPRLRALAPLRR